MNSRVEITPEMVEAWRRREAEGVSRRQISRDTGISLYRIMRAMGPKPQQVSYGPRQRQTIHSMPDLMHRAADFAKRLGYIVRTGEHTGMGNVGLLIDAIGAGDVVVLPRAAYGVLYTWAENWCDEYGCGEDWAEDLPKT